jgi:hypothetical protein
MENRNRLISVRKLAALDIVFHGPRWILVEFAVGMLITGFLGVWFLYRGLAPGPYHSLTTTVLGCGLLGVGLNYLPLWLYAFMISRQKSAQNEVASEVVHPDAYSKMYSLQGAILILVPFALLILALFQWARRS